MGVKQEKARQSCWCWTATGRQLAPIKPMRCHKMFDEATAFSKRLTQCETHIKALKKATDGMLAISEKTLSQPLPQTWENTPDGLDTQPVAGTGSPLIQPGQLGRSNSMDLQQKVHDPLTAWQTDYHRVKGRVAELDKASLRLDAARRAHYKGAQQHLKENVMQQDNVSARGTSEADNPELVAARNAFQKIDMEVHEELQQLAAKARECQGYLTTAMHLEGEKLTAAARAHGQPAQGGMAGQQGAMGVPGAMRQPAYGEQQQQQQMGGGGGYGQQGGVAAM